MYYGDGRTKSQKYYDWSFKLFDRLSHEDIQAGLEPFREHFDPAIHGFVLRLTAYYPVKKFYRLKGGISAKTMDLSNWEKPLIDCIMLPKHHVNKPPYGSPNLNVDDRYVVSLSSQKRVTSEEQPRIRISIRMIEFTELAPDPHPK